MIENMLDIGDKIFIIKHATLADVKIMDNNYLHLIHDTSDLDKQEELSILHTNAQLRIQELSN